MYCHCDLFILPTSLAGASCQPVMETRPEDVQRFAEEQTRRKNLMTWQGTGTPMERANTSILCGVITICAVRRIKFNQSSFSTQSTRSRHPALRICGQYYSAPFSSGAFNNIDFQRHLHLHQIPLPFPQHLDEAPLHMISAMLFSNWTDRGGLSSCRKTGQSDTWPGV